MAVDGGDEVVAPLNKVIAASSKAGIPIFFTRDWHPKNHMSFRAQGGIWPPHCVQGTRGAGFEPGLTIPKGAEIISKGEDLDKEAYSGFQGTDLAARLHRLGVDEIILGGLTTDYCVRESAIDALSGGFKVDVMEDCTRAVNVKPDDGAEALSEIERKGAVLTDSQSVVKRLASTQQ